MIIVNSYVFASSSSPEYPPIAMTANTSGGYTVLASTSFDGSSTYAAFKAFDKSSLTFWNSTLNRYNTASGVYIGAESDGGEWLDITLPVSINLKSISISTRSEAFFQNPVSFKINGWNGTTWTTILTVTGQSWSVVETRSFAVSTALSFSRYRYVITSIGANNDNGMTSCAELRLFAVNINEYPPVTMSADSQTLSASYGSGGYTLTANVSSNPALWNGFDKNTSSFLNLNSGNYNATTPFAYNGSVSTTVSSVGVLGDWVNIQLPNSIVLTSYSLTPRNDGSFAQCPRSWTIAGSNDGSTWTLIEARSGIVWVQGISQTFTIASPSTSFARYRLIIQASASHFPAISEWRLFGY